MKNLLDTYYKEPKASQLEEMRVKALEKKGRIVYLCRNARVRGDLVYCAEGCSLRGDRGTTISFLSVFKGICPSVCKECQKYDDEE